MCVVEKTRKRENTKNGGSKIATNCWQHPFTIYPHMDFHETRLGAVKEDRTLVDLTPLHEGAPFLKLTASGDPLERTYYLSEDNRYLKWNSNFWAFKSPEKKRSNLIC